MASDFERLPLRFEAERGQLAAGEVDSHVDFVVRGPGYMLYLSRSETAVALPPPSEGKGGEVVRMRMLGASPGRPGLGSDQLPGVTNYLRGADKDNWVTKVPSFARVTFADVYPGIEVVYYGDDKRRVEYDFNVAPGADPSVIALAFEGHRSMFINSDGDLVVATGAGNMVQRRPVIYQNVDGARRNVEGAYRISDDQVGFEVGAYDRNRPLVIDPVITYSSFLGGTATDEVNAIAVSRTGGLAYVTGKSCSTDLPTVGAPDQPETAGACDAFVAKFDTALAGSASLVYLTYLGGAPKPLPRPAPSQPYYTDVNTTYTYTNETTRGLDAGLGIAVDQAGRAYITGQTISDNFPTTPNAYDRFCGTGANHACWATYEKPQTTLSDRASPTIYVKYASDAFVTALTPDGSDLVYSTYLGGSPTAPSSNPGEQFPPQTEESGVDVGRAIAVDSNGNAYVTGSTTSQAFPTKNGFQEALNPSYSCANPPSCTSGRPDTHSDAFVVKIDTGAIGSASLVYGTYYGYLQGEVLERWKDIGTGIALGVSPEDSPGTVYVAGTTFSQLDFGDAFVLKVGTEVAQVSSTRLGVGTKRCTTVNDPRCSAGTGSDQANAIAVDRAGRVYITGQTDSIDLFEAATDPAPFQASRTGVLDRTPAEVDAFVASFEPSSLSLRYATYLGGSGGQGSGTIDVATGLAADATGSVYVTGFTESPSFPVKEPLQRALRAGDGHPSDAFVAKLAPDGSALEWSTYLGGGPTPGTLAAGEDKAHGLALDDDGNVYVTGRTGSNDFPTVGPFQAERSGDVDGFISKIGTAPEGVPNISSVEPSEGPPGTRVIIEGTGFVGGTPRFGDVTASSFVVESDTRIAAYSPVPTVPGTAVEVSVERAGAVSPAASRSVYTYEQGRWSPTDPGGTTIFVQSSFTLLDGPACTGGSKPSYCGKVLFVEGSGTRSARLYDPKTNTWSAANCTPVGPACPGRPTTARTGQTATLLSDGLVLVVAGDTVDPANRALGRRTAEIYDPSTGLWSLTGEMATTHSSGHTATLLDGPECRVTPAPNYCGNVLVVAAREVRAGTVAEGGRAAAELFDPKAMVPSTDPTGPPRRGQWKLTGDPALSRVTHTATLLTGDKCGAKCGMVMVAGGKDLDQASQEPTPSVELYDPAKALWSRIPDMGIARADQTATLLPNGTVLVAGGKSISAGDGNPLATAEIYDPAATDGAKAWRATGRMRAVRQGHAAVALPGGQVLVVGNAHSPLLTAAELFDPSLAGGVGGWQAAGKIQVGIPERAPAVLLSSRADAFGADPAVCGGNCGRVLFGSFFSASTANLYTPPPWVSSLSPKAGPVLGGTELALSGGGFDEQTQVYFGTTPASTTYVSYGEIRALSPPSPASVARIRVVSLVPRASASPAPDKQGIGVGEASSNFTVGVPAGVTDLVATALSDTKIKLSFSAPGAAGGTGPPARSYVVKQSRTAVGADNFDAAKSLCPGGICGGYEPVRVGDGLTLDIGGLLAGTRYHYAVKAVDDNGTLGEISNSAAALTEGTAATDDAAAVVDPGPVDSCATQAGIGQVAYPAGYSLVSLPGGTVIGAQSPLYSWLGLGAGGAYTVQGADQPVETGRGYWAWFSCPRLVHVSGIGQTSTSFALGAFHASMVGNPSGDSVSRITGHDFTARWEQNLNGGSGGYQISGHRQAQRLAIGEGIWAFSYAPTTVHIAGEA